MNLVMNLIHLYHVFELIKASCSLVILHDTIHSYCYSYSYVRTLFQMYFGVVDNI
jgi:hypothetical protein